MIWICLGGTSLAALGQVIPEVDIRINNTSTSKDDYVGNVYVPCTISLMNSNLSADLPVRLQTIIKTHSSAGQVVFSSTNVQDPVGLLSLDLNLNRFNATTTFFIKRRPIPTGTSGDYLSFRDKDAVIEVIDRRTDEDSRVLARKALRVAENASPLITQLQVVVNINGSFSTLDDYITWAPTPCDISFAPGSTFPSNGITVIIRNSAESGNGLQRLRFETSALMSYGTTATKPSIEVTIPPTGSARFYIAGNPGFPSIRDKDAVMEVVQGTSILTREAVMVRARKNANNLSGEEKERFLRTLNNLQTNGRYATFVGAHALSRFEGHDNSGFLPWHRAFILDLERELQRLEPAVTLPYWRFDQAAPQVFNTLFMGARPTGVDGLVEFDGLGVDNPIRLWAGTGIRRTPQFLDNAVPTPIRSETLTLALGGAGFIYADFRRPMEGDPHANAHNRAGSVPGDWLRSVSTSVNDPLFFLIHSNTDRLWAQWQRLRFRFDVTNASTYSPQGLYRVLDPVVHIGHFLEDTMWPWNGITSATGTSEPWQRPATSPGGFLQNALRFENAPSNSPRPRDMINYRNNVNILTINPGSGFCYDDVPF